MNALKVLVVDDEPHARARLCRLLARMPDVVVVGEAENGEQALERVTALQPDVVLLDIQMPGLDGLAVSELLAERDPAPAVVFTTAHASFALEAFELATTAPKTDLGDIAKTTPPLQVVVQDRNVTRLFEARTVTRFRAIDKYTAFLVDGREYLTRESLQTLEKRLGSGGFFRVHRSDLIRLDAVKAIEPEAGDALLHLADGQVVAVSRRLLPTLRKALGLRVG